MLAFNNDYSHGAHPAVLQALVDTNMEPQPGYGTDAHTERAKHLIREACQAPDADVFFLVGGTQANATVIDMLLAPYQGVVAAETGHVACHEAGAIEFGGHKVLTIPGYEGKMHAEDLENYIQVFYENESYEHTVFPGAVYVSLSTEYGTLYSKAELAAIHAVLSIFKPGDRIAVCISGSKDSMLMAKLFQELKLHNKFPFELRFLVMDPGYNEINRQKIESNAELLHIPVTIFESNIFSVANNTDKNPCYLCARMRRGHLYSKAKELGCNKIALGHHYDDVIETILMGMLYGGQVQTMMPKLHSTNFAGMELIRPLYLVRESSIEHWRDYNGLHFIQCACKFTDTCTSCNPDNTSKRKRTKELIQMLHAESPQVESNIFRSVEHVNIDTVIGYKQHGQLHSFLDSYDETE